MLGDMVSNYCVHSMEQMLLATNYWLSSMVRAGRDYRVYMDPALLYLPPGLQLSVDHDIGHESDLFYGVCYHCLCAYVSRLDTGDHGDG